MSLQQLFILILAFIIPITYQRLHFIYKRSHFEKLTSLRTKTKLQIHHAHWGILFIFLTTIWTLFYGKDIFSIIGFGYGWGLLVDEIIPSLKTASNDREAELKIYSNAAKPTLILITSIIFIFILAFILSK